MKANVPKAHFVISDFDHLITAVPGINAPIVSKKGLKSFDKNDFDTYLIPRGEADIFFPVNFSLLQAIYKQIFNRSSKIVKSFEFI